MKLLTILTVATLTATPVFAETTADESYKKREEKCLIAADVASKVMTIRQEQNPTIAEYFAAIDGNEILKEMGLVAWQTPAYSTPSSQQRAINDFSNSYFIHCLTQK